MKSNINKCEIDKIIVSMDHPRDLSYVRYFLAVAETLSFHRAAEQLNVAQPAVTRAVQQFEALLGFRLLERTTRRVELTPAGEVMAREGAAAIRLLERGRREAGQVAAGIAGEIIVAYSAQATNGVMPELIVRFRSAFPDAQVGLYSLSSDEQITALEDGRTDLGFLLSDACRAPLEHAVISRERFVLLVPLAHPLASRASVGMAELAGQPFVMGSPRRWGTFRSLIENTCLRAGFLPKLAEETDDVPVLMQLVSLGRGIALYGGSVAVALPPGIKAVAINDAHAEFSLSIAWRRDPAPLVKAFVAMAKQHQPSQSSQ